MEAGPAHPLPKVPSRPTFSKPPFSRPPFPHIIPTTRPVQMIAPLASLPVPQDQRPPTQDYRAVPQDHRSTQELRPSQGRRQMAAGSRPAPRHAAPAQGRDFWRRRRAEHAAPTTPTTPQEPRDDKMFPRMVQVIGFPGYTRPQDLVHAFSEFGTAKVDRMIGNTAALVFREPEEAAAAVRASTTVYLYGEFLTIKPYTKDMEHQRVARNYRGEVDKSKPKGPTVDPTTICWEGDFHVQLDALLTCVRLSQPEIQQLAALYHDLESVLKPIWPGCVTIPFGSVTTGLGVKASDADCFVLLPSGGGAARAQAVPRARRQLAHHPHLFSSLVAIPNANTPIVKFFHLPTNTHCDVSFKTLLGVQNSKLIGFLLYADPRLLPLAVVVKYWAAVHEVSGTGRLTNYALTMLLIYYLQQPPDPILPPVAWLQGDPATHCIVDGWNTGFMSDRDRLPPTANTASIADLIGGFFKFYSEFNFNDWAVCPYLGRDVRKETFRDLNQLPDEFERYKTNVTAGVVLPIRYNTPMCVQDPFEQCHNVASPVTSRLATEIRAYFKFAAETYEREKTKDCKHFLKTILLERPKMPRLKGKTEFRVTVYSNSLVNIDSSDWRVAADDVLDTIFNYILQLNLEPVKKPAAASDAEEAPESPEKKRKKVKYTGVLTRAIWKRKQFSKLYSAMRLKFSEREKNITEEIMTTDNNVINVPFHLAVTYINSPRTVILAIRPGAGDLQTFKEFGKFFQSVMMHWFIMVSKPYCDRRDKNNKLPDTSAAENKDVPENVTPGDEGDENAQGTDEDSDSDSDVSTEDERTPDAQTESKQDTNRQSDSEKSPSDTDKENIEETNNVDSKAASEDKSQSPKTQNDKEMSHKGKGKNTKNPSVNKNTPQHAASGGKAQRKGKSEKSQDSNSAIHNGEL